MPFQAVAERCGKWWFYWWAGPVLYIHAVDLGDVSPEYCEVAQPYALLGMRRGSIPVACVPLVYRAREDAWAVAGARGHHYRRADKLAKALAETVETWPYGCAWTPAGRVPPAVLDVGLLAEALERMPVYRLPPEELATDYVVWSYGQDLVGFLRSEFIHLVRSSRAEERWREICEREDPRACYPGPIGELLADIRARGLVPAVDASLFGARHKYTAPWGFAESSIRTQRGRVRVYYTVGHILREVVQRKRLVEPADSELPLLPVDGPIDPQGPIMRQRRRQGPKPVLEPTGEFPTSHGQEKGGPLAVFDLLDL